MNVPSDRKLTRSVKSLEGQIGELESEASRLLRALDTAKEAKAEMERTEKKRAEELAREVSAQVRLNLTVPKAPLSRRLADNT